MPAGVTKYSKSWEELPQCRGFLSRIVLKDGTEKAKCSLCNSTFDFCNGGISSIRKHFNGPTHLRLVEAKVSTKSVATFFGKFIFYLNFVIICNNN